jgi:ELWxxDGT repeat protein
MNKLILFSICFFLGLYANAYNLTMLKDLHSTSSFPNNYIEFQGKTFFTATDEKLGIELYITEGTAKTTRMFMDINPVGSSSPANFKIIGNTLYFSANDGVSGNELWKTDGTVAGTMMVEDINVGPNNSTFANFTELNGKLIFTNFLTTIGTELWISDGSSMGTFLVKDIVPGSTSSFPTNFKVFNNKMYFSATSNGMGAELFVTDGSDTGTKLLMDIYTGTTSSSPTNLIEYNGFLYFSASSPISLSELWRTDGTTLGTTMLKDINLGTSGSTPANFFIYNNLLYFTATTSTFGSEPWVTDGTTTGTKIVHDINKGVLSSSPLTYIAFQGTLFFTAISATSGREMWYYNGIDSPKLYMDLYPGTLNSSPTNLTVFQNELFFYGTNGNSRLFSIPSTLVGVKTIALNYPIQTSLNATITLIRKCNNSLFITGNYNADGTEPFILNDGMKYNFVKPIGTMFTNIKQYSTPIPISLYGVQMTDSAVISTSNNFTFSTSANGTFANKFKLSLNDYPTTFDTLWVRYYATTKDQFIGNISIYVSGLDTHSLPLFGWGNSFTFSKITTDTLAVFQAYKDSFSTVDSFQYYSTYTSDDVTVYSPSQFKISLDNISFSNTVTLNKIADSIPHSKIYVKYYPIQKGTVTQSLVFKNLTDTVLRYSLRGFGKVRPFLKMTPNVNDTFISIGLEKSSIHTFYIEGDGLVDSVLVGTTSTLFQVSKDSVNFTDRIFYKQIAGELKKVKFYGRFIPIDFGEYFYSFMGVSLNTNYAVTNVLGIAKKNAGLVQDTKSTIKVIPNPTTDAWNVTLDAQSEERVLELYSADNRLIFSRKVMQNIFVIDAKNLPMGIYHLVVTNADGCVGNITLKK